MFVASLGGSLVAPDAVDIETVGAIRRIVFEYLDRTGDRCALVIGGGAPARRYQQAYRELASQLALEGGDEAADWIGVMATRLNAELVRQALAPRCVDPVVTDPTAAFDFTGSILVGAGWKPGFSSDYDAVLLAKRFGATRVINLTNVERVYTADPRANPDARPLDAVSWPDFRAIVGDSWTPGANLPFDPIAAREAEMLGLEVIIARGANLDNLAAILAGEDFVGTRIG